jgi:hypothetical protein
MIPRNITLLLSCMIILLIGCRKEKYKYAGKIDGTYNWHRNYDIYRANVGGYTSGYPDERFEVKKRNKKQVEVKGEVLDLYEMDDYTVTYQSGEVSSTLRTLVYTKATGRLVYTVSSHGGAGANSSEWYVSF